MHRSNCTPKRNMGRPQPKRPKLDFSTRSSPQGQRKDSGNGSATKNSSSTVTENVQAMEIVPDWDDDDDFPSDMLEKVYEFADMSQAMINNEQRETNNKSTDKLKSIVSVVDGTENDSKVVENIEKLRLENAKLLETIKTKEGEVQILRSQLKQNQEAKQAETLNNTRLIKEMEHSYKEKLEATMKDFEATKTELQFKDLELKSLTERCQQLESNTSKIRLVEPQLTQVDCKKPSHNQKSKNNVEVEESKKEEPIVFEFPVQKLHEGRKFASLMCPEYFNSAQEPSVISLYKCKSRCGFHVSSLDFDKREKYMWSGLPKQSVFVKDTYNSISRLFLHENFSDRTVKDLIENLFDTSFKILHFQRELFLFLEKLQEKNSEHDDSDYMLLENEEEVSMITVKHLLGGKQLGKEECGLESRRVLAMIVALSMSSKFVTNIISDKLEFIQLLKDLVASVGSLRKSMRYTGILAGVTLLLNQLLREKSLKQSIITVLNSITEEIIFSRPKLDVLTLVVEALAAANNHVDYIKALCRKGPVGSCALYMDTKLHQAMFFKKVACPLKVLCIQIMGQSCIPTSRDMRLNVARSVTKFLYRMIDSPFCQEIKWIPTSSVLDAEDKCFDVTECFSYLLNCCLKDYFLISNLRDEVSSRRRSDILSIVGEGCLLFRRILKCDQRLLQENSHNLRFATLLVNLNYHTGLRTDQKEAVNWIIQLLKNPEYCAKQNASKSSDSSSYQDVIDSLKITDDLIIF